MNQSENTIPANAVNSPEKLYELSMIEQLCRGNQEQVIKMISVFIDQVPPSVEEIKIAYGKRDFLAIKKTAHKIKPTLTYYGIALLEKDIRFIEALAETESANELAIKIKKLDEVITAVAAQMKKDYL
ncbi:Hpt domain-containing protein [Ferruginibacter sp. SUN106]|uniref:Hpt domain-containing protein n=1 Tax=Ferruginibacter sp. SUN106 TaxID=2978348 RepID=UPI003D3673B6